MTTNKHNQARPQGTFRLLELPAELRNSVYEHLFAGSTTTILSLGYGYTIKHITSNGLHRFGLPALLRTSKQVREEAIGVFYANTKIIASETQHLKLWLVRQDLKFRKTIKCVRLDAILLSDYDVSKSRLRLLLERQLGYLRAILKQEELQMPECDIEARIVNSETGTVLWPREEVAAQR